MSTKGQKMQSLARGTFITTGMISLTLPLIAGTAQAAPKSSIPFLPQPHIQNNCYSGDFGRAAATKWREISWKAPKGLPDGTKVVITSGNRPLDIPALPGGRIPDGALDQTKGGEQVKHDAYTGGTDSGGGWRKDRNGPAFTSSIEYTVHFETPDGKKSPKSLALFTDFGGLRCKNEIARNGADPSTYEYSPDSPIGSTVKLLNQGTGKAADATQGSDRNIVQWSEHSGKWQDWKIESFGGGLAKIRNVEHNQCLSVSRGTSGLPVKGESCSTKLEQAWNITYKQEVGAFQIKNAATNESLAVPSNSAGDGAELITIPRSAEREPGTHLWDIQQVMSELPTKRKGTCDNQVFDGTDRISRELDAMCRLRPGGNNPSDRNIKSNVTPVVWQ
ncbi:RICIN domain-containing protein [Streptomyces sp. VTCC 41912]|uniref:RICIN domain-containing protein n=1 Tax=Streptomyces sp. VTCC 41912 TaxID=3383243 RepID=UPI003896DF39